MIRWACRSMSWESQRGGHASGLHEQSGCLHVLRYAPCSLRPGASLQTVDVSCNRLPELPARVSCLTSLIHLRASHNELCSLDWQALGSLSGLTKLVLDHNR